MLDKTTPPDSIHSLIQRLNTSQTPEGNFILAAAINLHNEAMRRIHSRIHYNTGDVQALFYLIEILFAKRDDSYQEGYTLDPEAEAKLMSSLQGRTVERRV